MIKIAPGASLLIAMCLLLAHTSTAAAETPAELISSFRLKHGQVRVIRDATLDRIAMAQARAMAEKDELSHEVPMRELLADQIWPGHDLNSGAC